VLSGELCSHRGTTCGQTSPQALGAYYWRLAAWQARRWAATGSAVAAWRAVWRGGTRGRRRRVDCPRAVGDRCCLGRRPAAVTFIDVGQDAAFIRFSRCAMLVDAGGSASTAYDVGERVVGPCCARPVFAVRHDRHHSWRRRPRAAPCRW
jgi:hypothetical protein